jgi:hypothetical protein
MIEQQRLLLDESRRFPDIIDGQHLVPGGFRERMPHGVAKRPAKSAQCFMLCSPRILTGGVREARYAVWP